MKNITQSLKIIALATILSFGFSFVYAWTAPTVMPPGGNVSAPINTSTTDQVKDGGLSINGWLHGNGNATFTGPVGVGTNGLGIDGLLLGYADALFRGRVGIGYPTLADRALHIAFNIPDTTITRNSGQLVVENTASGVNANTGIEFRSQNPTAGEGLRFLGNDVPGSTARVMGFDHGNRTFFFQIKDGTRPFQVWENGSATLSGTLTQNSDIRMKRDIISIPNALDYVSRLDGVTYYWKDAEKDHGQQIGLIAQDVEKVFPQVIRTDVQGLKSVAYQNLVAPIINAIREIKDWLLKTDARVSIFEAENAELRSKEIANKKEINTLSARLEKVEKILQLR